MKTAWNGSVETGDLEVGLERVALTAVAVAPNGDVDGAEGALIGTTVERVARKQDHPRAGSEHRHAVGDALGQRIEQARRLEQQRHRGRLAARHHERVDSREIRGIADLERMRAEISQYVAVGGERTLECEHAHLHLVASATSTAR